MHYTIVALYFNKTTTFIQILYHAFSVRITINFIHVDIKVENYVIAEANGQAKIACKFNKLSVAPEVKWLKGQHHEVMNTESKSK